MKYNIQAKVFGLTFMNLLKKYYNKHFPETDFKKYKKLIKKEYRAMLERTPSIGGKDNSMESNLVGCCFFFSMAKILPDFSPELMDNIINESMTSDFMVKIHKKKKEKGFVFCEKEQNKKVSESKKSQNTQNPFDWKYTFEKGNDEFKINFTQCGVCHLAKTENVEEYLPCMCKMDFPKYKLLGAKLYRTKTLASGDDCCNFHLVKMDDEK